MKDNGFDFDRVIDRRGTNCFKWDLAKKIFCGEDVLPMWVADMDFEAPPAVVDAIVKRARHGAYGYACRPDSFDASFIEWAAAKHGYGIEKDWICFSPGIVPALSVAVMALTSPGDRIMIQTPVYHPFYSVVTDSGRRLVENELRLSDGRYSIDFEDLEKKICSGVKMFILCSPHNPVGRVWKADELERMARMCIDNGVLIVSDEIHSDIVYAGHRHIPVASLAAQIEENTITLMSPSKTFNITGLSISTAVIRNASVREKFRKAIDDLHIGNTNIFGVEAFEAAYRHGAAWLDGLVAYLSSNVDAIERHLSEKLPDVKLIRPEGTFLAWLDFRKLGLDQKELNERIVKNGKLGLNDGAGFGKGGAGFMRLNFGCPRATLMDGLSRLERSFA